MRNITPKQERKMKKRILIVTNHSYMFWQFRKELVEALQKEHEVILAMPFVGHEEAASAKNQPGLCAYIFH